MDLRTDVPAFGAAFVQAYARHWRDHSAGLVRAFPAVADAFAIRGDRLADLACGEGTFAVGAAKRGWTVWGIDQSPDMLDMAAENARREGASVAWLRQDMRDLALPQQVDVITCWFNSLNYLPDEAAWTTALRAARRALVAGGWLVFDMYTPHGLATEWADADRVAVDTHDCYVVSRTSHNRRVFEAGVHFTGFIRDGDHYLRFDEHHLNRSYPWRSVRRMLAGAGFAARGRFTMPGIAPAGRRCVRAYVAAQAV